jgi:P4 family phage/plasmid primase-like protien
MDLEQLERLNKIFPKSKFVQIPKLPADMTLEVYSKLSSDEMRAIKRPMSAWKGDAGLTFEQAMIMAKNGFRLGWKIPMGVTVVDIDNKDSSESSNCVERMLLKQGTAYSYCRTAGGGVHFIFMDPERDCKSDARSKCAIGVTVDHRANETGYIILPVNDHMRQWGELRETNADIPYWLKSVPELKNKVETFIGLTEGGRNNELFVWRSHLARTGKFSSEQIEESIKLINLHLFDMPISEQELEATVIRPALRELDKEKAADGKTSLDKEDVYNTLAKEMTVDYDLISIGGGPRAQFYQRKGSYYKQMTDVQMEKLIHTEVNENIPARGRKELMHYLSLKTDVDMSELDKRWEIISCENGLLNLSTGDLCQSHPDDINTIYIPWRFNNNPKHSPMIDEFMSMLAGYYCNTDKCMKVDQKKLLFLYQVAGYCLLKKNAFRKFFIFQGRAGTGKSTFTELIMKMVGRDNTCSIPLSKMDADYYLATMISKLVCYDDDAEGSRTLENSGRFKTMVAGNSVTVRQIFLRPVTFTNFATIIVNCNELPRILDKTDGLYDRMVIVELNNRIVKRDPTWMTKITDLDMEYFIFKAVKAISYALHKGEFEIHQTSGDILKKFKRRQSAVYEYIHRHKHTLRYFYNTHCGAHFSMFHEWAVSNGFKSMTSTTFREEICALFDLEVRRLGDATHAQDTFTRNIAPLESMLEEMPV